ncbi:peptidase associated/transthyretin-like domain-containing protein [Alkalitalea saponilacus]|uniref:CarboxypepD_reg-like domain-containing protein n=1 Tax=Alkalitalea saponilacus TaxID=889453 RepID=A0A1T5EHU5_9BACT|nr:hypothetical protein [Alkalitalea saponilacus]ASB48980.1 hypothetical protein CDL62_07440 [Alkalitalea saponilacus]SKB83388.1 hypothetical protein SAMN03080601_01345 [Alkalitalea saponilacus]
MKHVSIAISFLIIICADLVSQTDTKVIWKGCVKIAEDNTPIPFATLASYKSLTMSASKADGCFELRLDKDDSLRVAAIGFLPRTISYNNAERDSSGNMIVFLEVQSYYISEVTVRPDQKPIELNLPSDIGSRMSGVPPNERRARASGPVSLVYNMLGGGDAPSPKDLERMRSRNRQFQQMEHMAGREAIETLSGLEGEQLDRFIIYCNIHLKVSPTDNTASVNGRILNLLERFLENEKDKK